LVEETFRLSAMFARCRFESLVVPFAPQHPTQMADRDDVKRSAEELAKKLAVGK
jgi:hypothetical protein